MAFISVSESARARLAATKGVSVVADPLPCRPEVTATVLAGIRCMHVRREGDAFHALWHVRLGEWITLADDVSEEAAFAAVLSFVRLVAGVSVDYSPANDAAERAAAAEVAMAFAAPFSIAA